MIVLRRPRRGPCPRLVGVRIATVLAVAAVLTACSDAQDPSPVSPSGSTGVLGPTSADTAGGAGHGGGSEVTTNPAAAATGPGIERFDAPATVSCAGATASVEVTWNAPDAVLVRFLVDGDDVGIDEPTSGTTTVGIPCDDSIHVILLAAVGADGATSVRSEAVLAEPES